MTTQSESTDKSTAFIIGYTGETGKSLVNELKERKVFKKVLLIGRRKVEIDSSLGPEFEQRIVDFDNLDQHKEAFRGSDVGFCCLGTTRKKAGKAGFIKVDHDYVVNAAKTAKDGGCKHFLVVSSMGSNKDSYLLYPKTKGETEEDLKNLKFEKLTILRPGLLMCDREESRFGESFMRSCVNVLFPQFILKRSAIHTDNLAKVMVNKALKPSDDSVETIENLPMYDLL